jgi:hypothetical protein
VHITFGLHLDAGVWPHPLHNRQAIAGHATVGPLGFLDILETHLGLTAPPSAATLRIAAFYQALHEQNSSTRFYHDSFATDPWGVAAHLLTWHDQLTEAGWTGQPLGDPGTRLHDLSSHPHPPQPSLAQRIWATVAHPKPFIETLYLADPLNDFPVPWQALLSNFPTQSLPTHPPTTPQIQHFRGSSPTETAELLASWLKHHAPPDTVLITESASDILDEALHHQDLPTLGSDRRSRWRPATQVLPLLLSLSWQPLDPYRLLEYLTLSRTPLPPTRYRLAEALMKSPGIDNPLWRTIYTPELDPWLGHLARYDRTQGIPIEDLKTLIAQVADWAATNDPTAHTQAQALQDALGFCTTPALPAAHLEQLVAQVTDQNTGRQTWPAESGNFYRVRHPGAILAPADTIVWWPFVDVPAPPAPPWTAAERAIAQQHDIILPTLSNTLRARDRAWHRPLQAKTLILASWARAGSEPVRPHPLADEFPHLIPTVLDLPSTPLAHRWGREPRPTWQVAPGLLSPRPKESATSIETLLQCPLRWTLHYHARLKPRPLMGLPDQEQLFGLLAHKIIQDVLLAQPPPATARTLAEDAFTRHLPAMAAALLQPSRTIERKRLSKTIARAAEHLAQHLHASPYTVVAVESQQQGTFQSSTLEGAIDILLSNQGQPALLDLKWTARRYRKKLLSGTAIQLAIYSHLIGSWAAGYYAVCDDQLLIPSGTAFTGRSPLHGPTLSDTLAATTSSHADRLAELTVGRIEATGHAELKDGLKDGVLTLKPPCQYCDYSAFCGAGKTP